jgi:hypothetical protein
LEEVFFLMEFEEICNGRCSSHSVFFYKSRSPICPLLRERIPLAPKTWFIEDIPDDSNETWQYIRNQHTLAVVACDIIPPTKKRRINKGNAIDDGCRMRQRRDKEASAEIEVIDAVQIDNLVLELNKVSPAPAPAPVSAILTCLTGVG